MLPGTALAGAVLLALPAVLAFFTGGYFDEPRLWAGLVAWAVALATLLGRPRRVPRRRDSWLAIGGLALLAVFSLVSIAWAPAADTALSSAQRLVVYAGILLAATVVFRGRSSQRSIEPALAGGLLLVVGYGLSERLLPGLLHWHRSLSAQGRLEQPLTYWNAMGEAAALGLILVVRLAGDHSRALGLRLAATAGAVPLGIGLYITFSRGALFAAAAGLLALVIVLPTRAALRALTVALPAAALAALVAAPSGAVTSLAGSLPRREQQGAITLAMLVLIAAAAVLVHRRLIAGRDEATEPRVRLPPRAPLLSLLVVCAGLAVAIVAGAHESARAPLSSGAGRLVTLQSDRYDYWRVAVRAFEHEPFHGVGAGNWSTLWLKWRPFHVGAQDAHSLPIQTLAELGLGGAALLLAACAGVVLALRRALRADRGLAAGPVAGLVGYVAHAPLDWDWQVPAVTAVALVLAGAALAQAESAAAEPAREPPAQPAGETAAAALFAPAGRPVLRWRSLAAAGVAVLACAWIGLSLLQVILQNRVTSLLQAHPRLTAAQARSAEDKLSVARFLNPGWNVRASQAVVADRAGRGAQALALAQAGVRYEPQNVNTWLFLALLVKNDPAVLARVEAHVRQLAPPVPPPR